MRSLAVAICLACPSVSAAETSLRQFHAEVAAPADIIISGLRATLPDTVFISAKDGGASISYQGLSTPPALLSFLVATYPDLPRLAFRKGAPVIVGLTITADSEITAMISADFPTNSNALAIPTEAKVLMDTTLPGDCAAQQVIAQPNDIETAAKTYKAVLKNAGFALADNAPGEVSYFIGRSDSCTAILYLQPDPDDPNATLVVLRLLED